MVTKQFKNKSFATAPMQFIEAWNYQSDLPSNRLYLFTYNLLYFFLGNVQYLFLCITFKSDITESSFLGSTSEHLLTPQRTVSCFPTFQYRPNWHRKAARHQILHPDQAVVSVLSPISSHQPASPSSVARFVSGAHRIADKEA